MFYQEIMDAAFRFGDVLRGYTLVSSDIQVPNLSENYKIDVNLPDFCVILSPCCSIGEKIISLSPLIKLRNSFFDNPYLVEDLTRINREMKPEESVPPYVWNSFPPEERQKRLEVGKGYAFLEFFVYNKNELFPTYIINRRQQNIETNYHMIDFRNTYKINCEKIISPKDAPLDSKCLQLSTQARTELRNKIAFYYARIPEEDKILED